jgi:hypothetical protein
MLVYQRVLPQWTSQQSMVLWYPPTWQSASTELQDIRTLKGCYLQGLVKSGKSISGAKKHRNPASKSGISWLYPYIFLILDVSFAKPRHNESQKSPPKSSGQVPGVEGV